MVEKRSQGATLKTMTTPQEPAGENSPKKKKKWPWIVGILAVLVIFGALIGTDDEDADTVANDSTATAAPTTTAAPVDTTEEQPMEEETTTEEAVEETDTESEALDEELRSFYGLGPGWESEHTTPGHWTGYVAGTHVDGRTLNVNLELAPGHPDIRDRAEEASDAIGNQIRANEPEGTERLTGIRVNDSEGDRVRQDNL